MNMKRRKFLLSIAGLGTACAAGLATYQYWPEQGFINPCLSGLPESLIHHHLLKQVWQGIDATQVWDSHAHLIGKGDAASGAWLSPTMDSYRHPLLKIQKYFYINAGCVDEDRIDSSYVARLLDLVADMPSGFKVMLYAFDWRHDSNGKVDKAHSLFHIPNAYAARIAKTHPHAFEWVASIHPYRADCIDALQSAVNQGVRAVKWLPSAMGIDPLSPLCDRFYQALANTHLPLISHAGRELAVQGGNQDDGNPLRLRRALDHGVKVVIAHCASDGNDQDMDQGAEAKRVKSFELFARLMDEPLYINRLYGDISALTQINRAWVLKTVLQRSDWHSRLLNGSDYPLPGVMPLFSASALADSDLLEPAVVPVLQAIRKYNPLLFDFALKRLLKFEHHVFPSSVFETRRFFTSQIRGSL
jgi:predicted TIM-barrel fold metal-dependent hydrolase